jgi:hypothetical protein
MIPREIPSPCPPLNRDYAELRPLRNEGPGRVWLSQWDPGRVMCSQCGGAWRLGGLQLDLVEQFGAGVECPGCSPPEPLEPLEPGEPAPWEACCPECGSSLAMREETWRFLIKLFPDLTPVCRYCEEAAPW